MARLRLNNVAGTAAGNPITLASGVATTASWTSAPAFATIVAPDYYVIVAEPGTANEEIMYLTAFTSGATSGTVTRAQEGTSGITHTATAWQHGPTVLDFGNGLAIFGDGSDGSPTFDGSTTILGMAPSSSIYTMTRDLFLASPTINSGVTIVANGFRFCVRDTLTGVGTAAIGWNGNNGGNGTTVGGTGGTATGNANSSINPTAAIGTAGGAGSTGTGANGTANSSKATGGAGGTGGSSTGGIGGSGGAVTAPTTSLSSPRFSPLAPLGIGINQGFFSNSVLFGGAGGGGGSGDGTNAGGGGGGGGPIVIVLARFIVGSLTISANGGNGGNGRATGATAGGGGGGGGLAIVISASVVAGAISGVTVTANGGTHGTPNSTGGTGVNGSPGTVILIPN